MDSSATIKGARAVRFAKAQTAPPASEVITKAEAKLYMKVSSSTEDDLVDIAIAAARENVEKRTGRVLLTQTWEFYIDYFPAVIRLYDLSPLQSVSKIEYVDIDGVTQTLSSSLYTVNAKRVPGEIVRAWGETWPSTRSVPNAVTVTAVVGYASIAAIPKTLIGYMNVLLAEMDISRQPIITGTIVSKVPLHILAAVDNYAVRRFS